MEVLEVEHLEQELKEGVEVLVDILADGEVIVMIILIHYLELVVEVDHIIQV